MALISGAVMACARLRIPARQFPPIRSLPRAHRPSPVANQPASRLRQADPQHGPIPVTVSVATLPWPWLKGKPAGQARLVDAYAPRLRAAASVHPGGSASNRLIGN